MQQAGYCPRSVFCAFAHVERKFADRRFEKGVCRKFLNSFFVTAYVLTEELTGRDLDSQALALSDMISSVLPPDNGSLSKKDKHELAVSVLSYLEAGRQEAGLGGGGGGGVLPFELEPQNFHSFFQLLQTNGSGAESSESASTSSLGSNHSNSHNKAPGSQLQQNKHNNCLLGGAAAGSVTAANCNGASLQATFYNNGGGGAASSLLSNNFPEFTPELRAQVGEQAKLAEQIRLHIFESVVFSNRPTPTPPSDHRDCVF